ncbi:hypothetical protein, partial [Escherichia coli]
DRNRSHWSTSKTPSYTKSVSWQHHHHIAHFNKLSFIPYSSTSAIIDFQLNHHLMNKNND